jgi:signal transduction histidine kinase
VTAAETVERAPTRTAPFAAYIAHEIRNPLAAQRALLELALADPDADIAAWRGVGRSVLEACEQQERVLAACIKLSRSESGLDCCELLDLAAISADRLGSTDLEGLTATIDLEPAITIGDPVLIELLLDNLLANAIRHNRADGWIAVTVATQARRAIVAIENTGAPIHTDELARLFEPFEHVHPPSPRGGLGLGLAVARTIADAHGARLEAHVRAGGGLRVEIAFPMANEFRPERRRSRPLSSERWHV